MLTFEQEKELSRKVRAKGPEAENARDVMFHSNIRLVLSVAGKFAFGGPPPEEILQEGCLGLLKAIERYDPEREVRFGTYAILWIRQAVFAYIKDSGLIRIPRHVVSAQFRLAAEEALFWETVPNQDTVLMERQAFQAGYLRSLPKLYSPTEKSVPENIDYIETFSSSDESPEEATVLKLFCEEVRKFVLTGEVGLTPREVDIFTRCALQEESTVVVAEELGISRQRVSQIVKRCYRRLRSRIGILQPEEG